MNKIIRDIATEIGSGITPLRSNALYWNSPDIPWIKTEQIGQYQIFDSNEYISAYAVADTNIRLWPPHTVSVAMYGEGKTRGNASILMIETTTNQACCNIIVNAEVADYHFLYYWLKKNYENLRAIAAGVRKNLNSDDIKSFPFPNLKLASQTKIADVLTALDNKIQINTQICSELETMAKTLYNYWFVQFDFPDEDGAPYQTSGGEMIWNEQLNKKIPYGWECVSLSDYISIENSSVNPATLGMKIMEHYSIPAYDENFYPAFEQATTIQSGKYQVHRKSILVSKLNPQFKRVWDPFCISENAICSTEFMVYMPRKDCLRPYCFALVNSDGFYQYMVSKAVSSTGSRKRIQPDVSLMYQFAAPNANALLSIFSERYRPIMDKMKQVRLENYRLVELRDWLLPMLMNGQAKVE